MILSLGPGLTIEYIPIQPIIFNVATQVQWIKPYYRKKSNVIGILTNLYLSPVFHTGFSCDTFWKSTFISMRQQRLKRCITIK